MPWAGVHRRDEIGLGLAEEQAVTLVLHGFMEPLANAIGLGVIGFGSSMVNVLHRQVKLVGVVFRLPAILRAPVGQNPA